MRINLSGGRAQKVQKSTELQPFKVLEKTQTLMFYHFYICSHFETLELT